MFAVKVVDISLEFARFDGGGNRQKELVPGVGGRIAGCGNPVTVEGGFGGRGSDEVAHGQLVKGWQVGMDLFPTAAGEQGDPGLRRVEAVLGGIGLPGKRGCGGLGVQERVADELGVYTSFAIEVLLEREDDEHLRDSLLDPAKASTLPRPQLRRYEPDDGDAGAAKMAGEAEVDVWKVDEDGDRRALPADGADQPAIAGIDVRDVAQDLCDTHHSDIFSADDLLLVLMGHLYAAETCEGGVGEAEADGGDDLGAVGVPGGFAGRKKNARIGDGSDGSSLSFVTENEVVLRIT